MKLFKNPFKSPENTDINTNTEQKKPILEKFRAAPQRTLRGISRKYATRAMAILAFGLATKKMRGQINPEYATGKYNTVKTVIDYDGPKSDIETQCHDNDASTQASWAQSVQTECLNPETQINEYANVPSSVFVAGNLGLTAVNYDKYVRHQAPYDNGNGRPDSADDRRGYVYQLQVNMDAMGGTLGNGTSYSTAVYDVRALDPVQSDGIIETHEAKGHGLGLYHTDATTFTMEVDYQQNGSFCCTETAKTVMSAGDVTGQYNQLMTCSVNNRADIAPDGYVYGTYGGYPARTLPANLDNSTSGDRSLDKLHNRLKIGGILHDRVYEETVPVDQKIENIPFNYTINGTVLTVQNFAGFNALTNPNNELPEDCQVFVYNANDTAEGHQIARFPAPRSNRIGWRWDEYGQIDFADFIAQHGGNLSDYAFRIRATHQNQMGPVGTEQATNTPPETFNSSVSVNEDETYTFNILNFTYSDNDSDPLAKIKIPTLPTHGTLKLNGTPITANQEIPANEISNLTYTPNANYNGTDTFTFSASDGTDWSTADIMTVNINAVNDAPSAPANLSVVSVNGDQVTLSFAPATDIDGTIDHYNIYVDGNTTTAYATSPSTNPTITVTNPGNHTVQVSAVDNLGAESDLTSPEGFVDVKENEKIAGLRMYPNPATNTLNIEIDGELDDIEIYNLQGILIREYDPQGTSIYQIDTSGLVKGIYFVYVYNKQGQKSVVKLVVK